jgi:hypothetical protein
LVGQGRLLRHQLRMRGMAAMIAAIDIVQSHFGLRISLSPHANNPGAADIMR